MSGQGSVVPSEGTNPVGRRYAPSGDEALREFARTLFTGEPSDLQYLPDGGEG